MQEAEWLTRKQRIVKWLQAPNPEWQVIPYDAQLAASVTVGFERADPRLRYTVPALDPAHASQSTARLKPAMRAFAPLQEIYVDLVSHDAPRPGLQPDGYPFRAERDVGSLARHKMNLIFATCGRADALVERGHISEAKRLL